MLSPHGNTFTTIVGGLIVCAWVVATVRAALLFRQGFEQGLRLRQKSDLQTIFSKDE
jgi:hypothetical protein